MIATQQRQKENVVPGALGAVATPNAPKLHHEVRKGIRLRIFLGSSPQSHRQQLSHVDKQEVILRYLQAKTEISLLGFSAP